MGVVIFSFMTELRRNPPWAKVRSCASTKTDVFTLLGTPGRWRVQLSLLEEESFEILPCLYAKDRFVATANAWLSVFQRLFTLNFDRYLHAKHRNRPIVSSR